MPLVTRESLVKLAREFDALIVCDDVYDFIWWDATTVDSKAPQGDLPFRAVLPRLVDVDRTLEPRPAPTSFGNVLSNGSFSKISGPGVRTGWVQSSTALLAQSVSQAGVTRSGGAASNLTGTILAHSLRTGALEKHMHETLRPAYAKRWRLMVGAIEQELGPLGVKIVGGKGDEVDPRAQQVNGMPKYVAGGFFIWMELPQGLTDLAVTSRALEDANVAIASESQTRLPPKNGHVSQERRNLRFCFAYEDEDKLVEGVKRLREVLETMLKEKEEGVVSYSEPNMIDKHQYA
jgi:DNA-binding transcriptional MocR family regulator